MASKKKINWGKVALWVLVYLSFVSLGFVLGMVYQQVIIQASLVNIASNMEGVSIEINLNESKLIEGFREVTEDLIIQEKGDKLTNGE